jgi:3-oxoacyl-[acyl-carrier-protein] synthase II
VIPEFEAHRFLGQKGTQFLDRTTALAITACGGALRHSGITVAADNQTRIGVVLGTDVGSIKSTADFFRDTLVQEKPYMVEPMHFPNAVINCAASQSAIWHHLKGVNTTISGGRLAGIQALRYAGLAISLGYSDALLAGSVEEFCEQTAWGFFHAGGGRAGRNVLLGEGCAMFTVENAKKTATAGRRSLATVLACEAGVSAPVAGAPSAAPAESLAACVRRAIDRSGVRARDVWAVTRHQFADPELEHAEGRALRLALGGDEPTHQVKIGELVGECLSAAGAFQLAGLLALFATTSGPSNRVGLMTCLSRGGAVGCALIREG